MTAVLLIFRYPQGREIFGVFSMALFRFFLWRNSTVDFFKLMGCGKGGSFSAIPDSRQWCLFYTLLVKPEEFAGQNASIFVLLKRLSPFIYRYIKFSKAEVFAVVLNPLEGFGAWDKKVLFSKQISRESDGPIAVLTRATIRLKSIPSFWQNVQAVSDQMKKSHGFIYSLGMGELPWIKQATFSVWQSKESLKNFAYHKSPHTEVIQKTRTEQWYKEEMFYRFTITKVMGSLKGCNPLQSVM